jgi:hypothetical protein
MQPSGARRGIDTTLNGRGTGMADGGVDSALNRMYTTLNRGTRHLKFEHHSVFM